MKIIDISWPIRQEITEYKDKKTVRIEQALTFENDGVRESVISFSAHTGTHVEGPSHFLQHGKTVDQLTFVSTIGACVVLDFTDVEEKITVEDLKKHEIKKDHIVLIKTKNSSLPINGPFKFDFIALDKSAAQHLVGIGVKAVGIDYLGVERSQNGGHPVHEELMKHDIAIIESLRLGHVEPGEYFLCCLPLSILGVEASPARAVLFEG